MKSINKMDTLQKYLDRVSRVPQASVGHPRSCCHSARYLPPNQTKIEKMNERSNKVLFSIFNSGILIILFRINKKTRQLPTFAHARRYYSAGMKKLGVFSLLVSEGVRQLGLDLGMKRLPMLVKDCSLLSLLLDLGSDHSELVEDMCDIVSRVSHQGNVCRLAWTLGNDGGVIVLLLELLFLGGSRLSWSSRSVINI